MFDELLKQIVALHENVKALDTAQGDENTARAELQTLRQNFEAAAIEAERKVAEAAAATRAKLNQVAADRVELDKLVDALLPQTTTQDQDAPKLDVSPPPLDGADG